MSRRAVFPAPGGPTTTGTPPAPACAASSRRSTSRASR
jgi:hypothetical protein